MLAKVKRADGKEVSFEYDALGRRTAKIFNGEITRFVWDGNVLLHEWKYNVKQRPQLIIDEDGNVHKNQAETIVNLITWVYERGSYVPTAKIEGDRKATIISDYIGRPIQAYNEEGNLLWSTEYNIFGKLKNIKGEKSFIPFRQLGQYEDEELEGLYYNRFRYYDSESGLYLSKDPIGLYGNNPNTYAFVSNSNTWVDIYGLHELNFLQELVKDAHSTLGSGTGFSVTAVGVDADGNYYVSSSKKYVPKQIKDWAKEMGVTVIQSKADNVHAEEALINSKKGIGEIEPSSRICLDCNIHMQNNNVKSTTGRTGAYSKNRTEGGKYHIEGGKYKLECN